MLFMLSFICSTTFVCWQSAKANKRTAYVFGIKHFSRMQLIFVGFVKQIYALYVYLNCHQLAL